MLLTANQMKVLSQGEPVPVKVGDEECVVLQKHVFDQLKCLKHDDSDLDVREMEPLLSDLAAEDWEDASNYKKT